MSNSEHVRTISITFFCLSSTSGLNGNEMRDRRIPNSPWSTFVVSGSWSSTSGSPVYTCPRWLSQITPPKASNSIPGILRVFEHRLRYAFLDYPASLRIASNKANSPDFLVKYVMRAESTKDSETRMKQIDNLHGPFEGST